MITAVALFFSLHIKKNPIIKAFEEQEYNWNTSILFSYNAARYFATILKRELFPIKKIIFAIL